MNANLHHQIVATLDDLSRAALISPEHGSISYRALLERAARFANVLASVGLRPGDRLAAQIEKSVDAVALYLATVQAGGVFIPLNTGYTAAEVSYFLRDAEPAVIVLDPSKRRGLSSCIGELKSVLLTLSQTGSGSLVNMAARAASEFTTIERDKDDLAAILYTSGTTGRSKGAMLTHGNLTSNGVTLRDLWQFSKNDVLIHALPIFHTHGLFVAINVTMLASASMVFLPKFDVGQVLHFMPQATCLMGVPTFYTRLLEDPLLTREITQHMRLFISGSAPLLSDTHHKWFDRTGHSILERYGMTEANMIASNPYDGERLPGTVGLPLPDVSVRIANHEADQENSAADIGMIEVKGPNVFHGYWRMADKTAADFRSDGYFVTGDMGRFDEHGYLHILGRSKDLIITGGFNVYPKEIEREIDLLPGIVESAVFGIPHADFGEAVIAAVVRRDESSDGATIRSELANKLARFKLPKEIVFLRELPRNAMGKVQKEQLRKNFLQQFG